MRFFHRLGCTLPVVALLVSEQPLLCRASPGEKQQVNQSLLDDPRAGHWLNRAEPATLWWAESGWKIGRTRQPPRPEKSNQGGAIHLAAAKGEYEAVQVILTPRVAAELTAVELGNVTNAAGRALAAKVTWDEVAYVHVTVPTDKTCRPGWYPDPLPPLRLPLKLEPGRNQPLWLTLHISREAEAGHYRGQVGLTVGGETLHAPLAVQVYNFALPKETHLHSALGLGTSRINRYYHLSKASDRIAVFDKYLKDFAAHRISPYSFYDYAPIDVRFVGEGQAQHAVVNFKAFDQAAKRWLDRNHFSTFRLPLLGMGGGTFYHRSLGKLAGFPEGTPEHARLFKDYLGQVEAHLRAHGWLRKAFTYWFDEPAPRDYDFVVSGMERLKAAAPGIRRMLTEEPEPKLLGHVDIWCGLTPHWTPDVVRARRAAGEEVWWYICTGPKAPYVTEFIDHPGTELRLWPWQSWQYGVTGILIWATTYWTSPQAYPGPQMQDPWKDPMSWVTGYGTAKGRRRPWGNGDGRFLYPPRRDPNADVSPCLDGPIDSFRWENLRDGMEDYEYFWRLNREVTRVSVLPGHAALVRKAQALLQVPPSVSRDLTHFTTDPRLLLRHRDAIARMIERLKAVR